MTRKSAAARRVLVLSMIFPPDGVSSAQLLGDICEDMHRDGVDVQVVTTEPHYNTDSAAAAVQPIQWSRSRLTGTSNYRGVSVTHIRMNSKSASSAGRLLQWGWFHVAAALVGVRNRKQFDGVLCISPPPTVAVVGGLISRLTNARLVFCVWELYPEILIPLGKLTRGSFWHRLLLRVERLTYSGADIIAPLNDAMRDSIVERYPEFGSRVQTIPTFADTDFLTPLPRMNSIRERYELGDSFVVGYAGNLAATQNIETMLDAADSPACPSSLRFLISGGGSMEKTIEQRARSAPNENIRFTGHLPYTIVPELYAASDVCVISLDSGISDSALPSKLYRIMAAGRPIIAITAHDSPLAEFVRSRRVGVVVDPNDVDAFLGAVANMATDQDATEEMGRRGRVVAVEEFSRPVVSRKYVDALGIGIDR